MVKSLAKRYWGRGDSGIAALMKCCLHAFFLDGIYLLFFNCKEQLEKKGYLIAGHVVDIECHGSPY